MSAARNIQILKKAFSPEDWEYLSQDPVFKAVLSQKNETLEDYEELVDLADLLLKRRDGKSASNRRF